MAKVLFICLGNICRSPTAQAVFEHLVEREGLADKIKVASAGTGGWHVGNPPDERAQWFASMRGYSMKHLRAKQVHVRDFDDYDLILAMDRSNQRALLEICPDTCRDKVRLFLDFASQTQHREVPDPYYGGDDGFELVLDLVEDASQGVLQYLRNNGLV